MQNSCVWCVLNFTCFLAALQTILASILQVVEVQSGKARKKTKLRVFSFTHKREKVLAGDVSGRFTTDPKLSAFCITDLMKYVPNPFPVSVRLFLDEEATERALLPDVLTKDPVCLLDSTVETSLVATCELLGKTEGTWATTSTIVEIPTRQEVLISLFGSDPIGQSNSLETLRTKSLALWKNLLSPGGAKVAVMRLVDSGEHPTTQDKLFAMVDKALDRECQAIKAPRRLQKDIVLPTDEGSADMQTYQALTSETEMESEYAGVAPSLTNSDYEDSESLEVDVLEDNPFFTSDEKVHTVSLK